MYQAWPSEHMPNRSVSLVILQAFSKPCLVNLISKDTNLVAFIYEPYPYLLYRGGGGAGGQGQVGTVGLDPHENHKAIWYLFNTGHIP